MKSVEPRLLPLNAKTDHNVLFLAHSLWTFNSIHAKSLIFICMFKYFESNNINNTL